MLKWLTILSLDAPLVALCWQAAFATSFHTHLAWFHRFLLAAPIWLGYAADRWFDTRSKGKNTLQKRHLWYSRRPKAFLILWGTVIGTSLFIAYRSLNTAELSQGYLLVGLSLIYSAFAQFGRKVSGYGTIKCALIASLVTLSSTIFVSDLRELTSEHLPTLLVAFSLFFLNCLYLRSWEKKLPFSKYWVQILALLILPIAFLSPVDWHIRGPAILSVALLYSLDRVRRRFDPETARTLADIALMTPVLWIVFN